MATGLRPVNVSSVPQRSPFRYPGGKTWLIPYFRQWIASLGFRPRIFVEPFAGGASIALTAAMESLADHVVIAEIDPNVASVWKVILSGNSRQLSSRILSFEMTRENVIAALNTKPRTLVDQAFQTILRNRVQRGGIMAPGASLIKNGENGKGIGSRWYPTTLAKRIDAIAALSHRIEFRETDALRLIPQFLHERFCAFFIDPPYTAGGKRAGRRLYSVSDVDHEELFAMLSRSAGSFMMTYDDANEPRFLAEKHGFQVSQIPMSNTHHETMVELVITN